MVDSPDFPTSPEREARVSALLAATHKSSVPPFWHPPLATEIYIPVPDGEIRVLHICPSSPRSRRPLVFVPGWGVLPTGFVDLYEALHDEIELYYIETREKKSSRMNYWKAKFSMADKAADVGIALQQLQLADRDFVIAGSCWGAAIILQGVMDHTISAPTVITIDPMNRLWFSRWILKYLLPFLPVCLIYVLRPLIKWLKLRKMPDGVQKRRAEAFVNGAVLWKWKRAGQHTYDFHLFGRLAQIDREVIVVNGTKDLIHEPSNYPKIARELPRGRFFYLPADESQRERLMGVVGRAFASVTQEEGIPPTLREFEVPIR